MKIKKSYATHLNENMLGRLRLKLFQVITGRDNEVPTKNEGISYITNLAHRNFETAELFTYILTQGYFSRLEEKHLLFPKSIDHLFKDLNEFPLTKPLLFELKSLQDDGNKCAWVSCDMLQNNIGYVYSVILFNELSFPEKIIGYTEIRVSQKEPEPAISIISNKKPLNRSRKFLEKNKNPIIDLSIKILNHISNNPVDNFIPIHKAKKFADKKKINSPQFPKDKLLTKLLRQLRKGEIHCCTASVDLSIVIPFSYDYCFSIPPFLIRHAENLIEEINQNGILLYWNGTNYIMSDDYIAYLALRKCNYKIVKATIIGKYPSDLTIIRTGGMELLPSFFAMQERDHDSLPVYMKESELEQYLSQLNTIDRLKNISDSKCIVFTEDSNVEILENILISNGFNIDETIIYSYKNSTRLDSLEFNFQAILDINPNLKIVVHRDRDYLPDKEVAKIEKRISSLGALPLITKGTDIESYYLNVTHIHFLYPQVSIKKLTEILARVFVVCRESSIQNIKKHDYGEKYKTKSTHLDSLLETLYDQNKERFIDGKMAFGFLISFLQEELKQNPDLVQESPFLKIPLLESFATEIWSDD